jgi:chemotaxis protein MotB
MEDNEFSLHKSNNEEQADGEGSWIVSYADMITVLLAFFVIFFSLGKKSGDQAAKEIRLSLNKNDIIKELPSKEQQLLKSNNINKTIIKAIGASTYQNNNQIIIEFPGISFFKSGDTELSKEGKASLSNFIKKYLPYSGSYQMSIRAYTDQKKVSKNKKHRYNDNLELSSLRAISSMRYLQKSGIPLNRMRIAGYGELKSTAEFLNEQYKVKKVSKNEVFNLSRKIVIVIEQENL